MALLSASITPTNLVTTSGAATLSNKTFSDNPTFSGGTANGVTYLNGSKVLTSGSALTYNGTSLGIGSSSYGDAGTITASIGVAGTTAGGLQLWATSAQEHYIQWGDSTTGSATYAGAISYSHASDFMRFWTGSTERMRLTSTGLGIGTTAPAQKLHVLSASANATVAKFSATNYGNLGTTYIEIGTEFGDGGSRIGNINPVNNQSILVFETMTATSGTYAERARIENNGNLLVGTTSQIGATASRQVIKFDNNNFYGLALGGSASGAAGMLNFYNSAGTEQGYISTTGSGSTSYVTSSDYRLKENIAPMTGALAKVAQLKPVTYTWKEDGSSGQGFIAHELQAIVPDCVTREKDAVDADGNPKYQGVDTSFLVATLTAAIQELKAEFDAYKASHP